MLPGTVRTFCRLSVSITQFAARVTDTELPYSFAKRSDFVNVGFSPIRDFDFVTALHSNPHTILIRVCVLARFPRPMQPAEFFGSDINRHLRLRIIQYTDFTTR
jgi:hypothetical protein